VVFVGTGCGITGDTTVASEGGITRTAPLSDLVASAVFDVDATIGDSYGGTGQTWANIIADTDYNHTLGNNASPSTDDPTFTGTPDDPAAYFNFDGGDRMHWTNGLPDLIKQMHRTDIAQDWTLVWAGRSPASGGQFPFLRTGSGTAASQGVQLSWSASNGLLYQHYGDAASSFKRTFDVVGADEDFVLAIGYDHAAGEVTFWSNGAAGETVSFVLTTATADAATNTIFFAAAFPSNGSRIYAVSGFNEKLSDADFAKVAEHYELRHNRSYLA
jgi:hypothetical protein